MGNKGHNVIDVNKIAKSFIIEKVAAKEGAVLLECEYVVSDPKTSKIHHQHTELGDSFVANFIKILAMQCSHHYAMDTGSAQTLKDTGGSVRTGDDTYAGNRTSVFDCNALVTDDTHGILVGTGDTAVDINDYVLDTPVAEGGSATQMNYGNHSVVVPADDESTYSYAGITRTIVNNSGSAIEVAEIGLVACMRWDSSNLRYFLLLREVLGSAVEVGDGLTLTVTIRVKCFC